MSGTEDDASDAASSVSYTRPRAYLVDDVDELQIRLGLPDVRRRSGLKRACISFETVREALYAHTAKKWDNDHEMTLVALTWHRMCEDAHILALVRKDPRKISSVFLVAVHRLMCSPEMLEYLVSLVHPARKEAAEISGLFLVERLTEDLPADVVVLYCPLARALVLSVSKAKGDNLISELALSCLSNILSAAAVTKEQDTVLPFLESVYHMTVYSNDVGRVTFNRTASILTEFLNQRCMWMGKKWAEACILYSIGLARRGTARQRRLGLRNLTHLCDPTPLYDWQPDFMARSLQKLELTSEMRTAMRQYGLDKCETTRVLRNMNAVGDAVNEAFARDGPPDLARLGLRLCELVRADPICVCFDDNFPRRARLGTGDPRKYDAHFDEWADLLTNCAAAVRQLPKKSVLLPVSGTKATTDDVADILDIHHHILRHDCFCTDLESISRHAFERNSSDMFFVFPLLRSPELDLALSISKLAKSYVNRDDPTPFEMIFIACLANGLWEGVLKIDVKDSRAAKSWRNIVKGAHAALEYANLYLKLCAPDALYRDRMLTVKALAMQLIHGPGSKLLADTKGFLRPSRLAHEFYGAIWKKDGYSESYDALSYLLEHNTYVGRFMDPPLKRLFPGITPSRAADEFERGDRIPDRRQFSMEEFDEWDR
ncbi:hypothetical protein EXIGLDRAFT_337884 [Exidia glandulosa HHB12029]|uniref:Uncharacterized protein n=1 Tax=Exidia glandulosa HHB12029 TaxID=1314781 RepID=A0A165LJD7_EXIGL|nr:hypothetical protein EXIGLDRAFT_337884 [Exidia glandulosa HHB12029]